MGIIRKDDDNVTVFDKDLFNVRYVQIEPVESVNPESLNPIDCFQYFEPENENITESEDSFKQTNDESPEQPRAEPLEQNKTNEKSI